jgi:5'-nucleotidase
MRVPQAVAVICGAVLVSLLVAGNGVAATHHSAGSAASRPLQIMVTNDDGYNAPGIATMSSTLAHMSNVHVTVVAPATNQSGVGGSTTTGTLKITKGKTLNGLPAYAIAGTPADTIRAALNQLHLHPDLVVSGVNAGQNLGPAIDLSGTVGAARAAVARGIPAIAVSSGFSTPFSGPYRFGAAANYVVRWVRYMRNILIHHHATVHVLSINVPSCYTGSVRGVVRAQPDLNTADLNAAVAVADCTSTSPPGTTDVTAFAVGFATESVVPAKPAS